MHTPTLSHKATVNLFFFFPSLSLTQNPPVSAVWDPPVGRGDCTSPSLVLPLTCLTFRLSATWYSETRSTSWDFYTSKCWRGRTSEGRGFSAALQPLVVSQIVLSMRSVSSEQAFADSPQEHIPSRKLGWQQTLAKKTQAIVFPLFHYQLAERTHHQNRSVSFDVKAWRLQQGGLVPWPSALSSQMVPNVVWSKLMNISHGTSAPAACFITKGSLRARTQTCSDAKKSAPGLDVNTEVMMMMHPIIISKSSLSLSQMLIRESSTWWPIPDRAIGMANRIQAFTSTFILLIILLYFCDDLIITEMLDIWNSLISIGLPW